MEFLLASNSPRRKEPLQSLGYTFSVVSVDCEETFPEELPAAEVAPYLSLLKSKAYGNLHENQILITADTVVIFEGKILGKPKNREEAFLILRSLSGKKHEVHSAITVRTISETVKKSDVATVYFDNISDEEIEYYLENFKPFDKAGSYGIQEWIGMAKCTKIEGSFYTIMGLPTHLLYEILKRLI